MLITSIYCAHNMGAHCACASRSSLTVPRPCRLHLSTPAPPATCDACIAGHAAAAASGSAASRFPTACFCAFFLLLVLFFYSYCSCTANSIIVNANFCPIPNPIPLRMFCFSIEDSQRTFSVSAFYLLLIYATLARSRHTPSRLPAPHRLPAPPTLCACRARSLCSLKQSLNICQVC